MKKTVLTLGIISLFFTACKKEQATTSDQPTINVSDTKALTSAITVYHSSKIKGAVPAPSTGAGAPVLDPGSDNQQINAMNGRYAVIKPSVFSGDVAGYYLKINGADFYYKIDFSKPRLSANRLAGKTTGLHNRLFSIGRQANANRADSTQPGYADSSIIIQLPANIGTGTFCAEYWMYNDQDQLSNPIKICVTVNQLGGGADGAGFVGKWKETKEKYTDPRQDTNWHTITYAKEYAETSNFLCDNGVLYYSTDSSGSNPDILHIANRYYWNKKADFIFCFEWRRGIPERLGRRIFRYRSIFLQQLCLPCRRPGIRGQYRWMEL